MSMRLSINNVLRVNGYLLSLLKQYFPQSLYLFLRILYNQRKKTVSQMGQDFWVFGEVFNEMENGYFLEVGSADGIFLSNTFLLEKRYHWRGICIEADPLSFRNLGKSRNAVCVNACVDSTEGEVEFVQRQHGYAGIVDEDTDNKREERQTMNSNFLKLKTRTLWSILREQKAPAVIDYLSIDVEGSEDRVLCKFPFDEYRFNCITIERPKPRLREIFARNGYVLVKEIPGHDVFYIHESFYSIYEQNVFKFWGRQSQ